MKRTIAIIAIALATPGLAGCQGLFGPSGNSRVASTDADLNSYFAEQLGEGKALLGRQQYGAALAAFRQARLHPEHAGEAYNGMAVAYAKLGRADLAERFFLAASAVDPGNPRYLANLQRLQDSRPVMTAAAPAEQQVEVKAERVAVDTGRAVIRFGLPQAALVRDGAKDVHLVTMRAPEAKVAPVMAQVPAPAAAKRPAAQVAARAPQADYPVRTTFVRRPAEVHIVTSGNTSTYPQRVALGK